MGRPPWAAWAFRIASGGSPGNYLLKANFGKISEEGWGGLFQVARFAFYPCMFFWGVTRFVWEAAQHQVRPWNVLPASPGRWPSCRAPDKQEQAGKQGGAGRGVGIAGAQEWRLKAALAACLRLQGVGGRLPASRWRAFAEGLEIRTHGRSLTGPPPCCKWEACIPEAPV